jgi:hypothetical protein
MEPLAGPINNSKLDFPRNADSIRRARAVANLLGKVDYGGVAEPYSAGRQKGGT